MKENLANVVIENVLTDKEIQEIYESVEKVKPTFVIKSFAQTVSDFALSDDVRKKIIAYCEEVSQESDLEITECQFARYKGIIDEDTGEPIMPMLPPHLDDAFLEPRFTFDYQIGGNTDWPLIVEEKEFVLKNNQALTFAGTHQVHWRSKRSFSEDEYLDMLFIHLKKKNTDESVIGLIPQMAKKIKYYEDLYSSLEKSE